MPFIQVDGIQVHYEEAGSGEPALLIHGWGATLKFWRGMLAPLSAHYRCVAIDLPGFGESDKPDVPYTIEWFAGFVGKLLDALGWQKAVFCGHSMGGMISSLFASQHPERVERLVVVNPPIHGPSSLFAKAKFMLLPVFRWFMWIFMHVKFVRHWVSRDFTYKVRLADDVIDGVIATTYASSIGSVLSLKSTDVVPHLRSIQAPTLVLGTDNDGVIHTSQHALAAREIPGATHVVIADCGHCPMFEAPDAFSRAITDFLVPARSQSPLDPAVAPR